MDQWMSFVQDRWFVIVIALIVLFLVVKIVKTFVKWLLVLVIIAALVFYGASYKDKLVDLGNGLATGAKEQAMQVLEKEAADAKYRQNPDGTFTVTTKSLTVDGKVGSNEVTVNYNGLKTTLKVNDVVNAFIERAKQN